MQIYIEKDGEKTGPFPLFRVEQDIREGRLPGETLAWYEGCEGWSRVDRLAPFDRLFDRLQEERAIARSEEIRRRQEESEATLQPGARPWVRFAARLFDQMLVIHVVVGLAYLVDLTTATEVSYGMIARSEFFLLLGWMIIESLCLHHYGRTPGKWIMGLRVTRADGSRVDLPACFRRSLSVLVIGQGMGLLGVRQVAEAVHYFIVRRTGIAFWDRGLGLKVHYQPIHWSRVLLPLAFMVLVVGTLLREPYNEMTREIIDEVTRGAGGAGSAAESEVLPEIP